MATPIKVGPIDLPEGTKSIELIINPITGVVQPPPVSVKLAVSVGISSVSVAVTDGPGGPTDWVAIVNKNSPAGTDPASAIGRFDWYYLNGLKVAPTQGKTSSNLLFNLPPPGTYIARYYINNTFSVLSAVEFTVSQTTPPPTGRALVSKAQYLGKYIFKDFGSSVTYWKGMTGHRNPAGVLRLLIGDGQGGLMAIQPPNDFGVVPASAVVSSWRLPFGVIGLWAEPGPGLRVWCSNCVDYPSDQEAVNPLAIGTFVITGDGSPGTISTPRGLFGLQGIGARAIDTMVTGIPKYWREANGIANCYYLVGAGGYHSRMGVDFTPGMGPMLIAMQNPHDLVNDSALDPSRFKILADYRVNKTTKRGLQKWPHENYFDGGGKNDDQGNRPRPDYPPLTTGQYITPNADGTWPWVWGNAYYSGHWVDNQDGTLPYHGICLLLTGHTGKCWYAGSTLHFDGCTAELHVYSPAQLAEVLKGQRATDDVKPVNIIDLTADIVGSADVSSIHPYLPPGALWTGGGNCPFWGAGGSYYDQLTGKFYALRSWAQGGPETGGSLAFEAHVHCWQLG